MITLEIISNLIKNTTMSTFDDTRTDKIRSQ